MAELLRHSAKTFKGPRSQSAIRVPYLGSREGSPQILKCTYKSKTEEPNQPPNFKNLKFWKIISTDVQKSFLKAEFIKKPEKNFRLSHIDEFEFMFDETLEVQHDIIFKLQNQITGETSSSSFG